jgi:hypothetical protein
MVRHPAGDPPQEDPIGRAKEVDDDPPFRLASGAAPSVRRGEGGRPMEKLSEVLRDRVEELPLLLEERALVRRGAALEVDHLDLSHWLPLHEEWRGLAPRRLREAGGNEGPVLPGDACAADPGMLPSRRDHLRDRSQGVVDRQVVAREDLVDPVEAVQLLRSFLEGMEDAIERARDRSARSSAARRTTPAPRRPSTRTSSGRSGR